MVMREIHVWSTQRRATGAVVPVFGEGLGLCPPLEAQQSFFVALSPLWCVHCTAFVTFFSSIDRSECDETREMQSGEYADIFIGGYLYTGLKCVCGLLVFLSGRNKEAFSDGIVSISRMPMCLRYK